LLVLAGAGGAFALLRHDKKTPAAKPQTDIAESGSATRPAAVPVDAQVTAEVVDAAAPTPTTVIVTIEGVPKGTQVMRNGERIGLAPKVELAYGTKEVPLVLQAPGYDPEQLVVTPDDDKSVSVKLTKTKTTHSQQTHEQAPDRDALDDPFKKKKSKD